MSLAVKADTSPRGRLAVGYSYAEHTYHVAHENWMRVARGVYRLCGFPSPARDDLIVLSLLSHDRSGQPQAVVSHETALALHDLSDVNPVVIHLTVPQKFRRQMPPTVVLHRADVPEMDWEERDGYRVTTPLRTLRDVAADPSLWPYLDDAVRQALVRGLVRRRSLLGAMGNEQMKGRLSRSIARASQQGAV